MRQGIGAIATMVEGHNEDLISPWPPDLVARVADRFLAGRTLVSANMEVPRAALVQTLEAVRNRILKFALEIERQWPQAGESFGVTTVPAERVSQIFNTYIMGGTQNVAVGSSGFSQSIHAVQAGDMQSLKDYLSGMGVEKPDLDEIERALKEDPRPTQADKLGPKTSSWIGKMIGKAASGVWNVATSTAASLLTEAIKGYYGFPA